MSKELVVNNKDTKVGLLTKENINTLVQAQIIPKGTPLPQIQLFAQICNERGLSPFSKEVYLVEYGSKYSVVVGINGFRKIAAETREYAGCDDTKYNLMPDGSFQTSTSLIESKQMPKSATVTVYRVVAGLKVGFSHTAVFNEFSSGRQKWKTMPFQMISKVAEAFALRKGFSDRLTGLSIPEEEAAYMDIQGVQDIDLSIVYNQIAAITNIDDLSLFYQNNPDLHGSQAFLDAMTARKTQLKNKDND